MSPILDVSPDAVAARHKAWEDKRREEHLKRHAAVVKVACPSCGATSGEPCIQYRNNYFGKCDGHVVDNPHAIRRHIARALDRKAP